MARADEFIFTNGTFDDLMAYVNEEPCLAKYIGQIHVRNACRAPWINTFDVRVNVEGQSATFYLNEPYVSGTLSADGRVRLERLDNMTIEQLTRIMAVLSTRMVKVLD